MPAMLIGLNKIPQISFMASYATSLLSIWDPNNISDPSLGLGLGLGLGPGSGVGVGERVGVGLGLGLGER